MIKIGDYILVDDFGFKCLCKLLSVGRDPSPIRSVSVMLLEPYLSNEAFRIVIDIRKIVILDENQTKVVKVLYE